MTDPALSGVGGSPEPAELIERLGEEYDLLGLMSYSGTSWGGWIADLNQDDIAKIRALLLDAGSAIAASRSGAAALHEALERYVEAADWYRRCLEDVTDRRPVRGLSEARSGYDHALEHARAALAAAGTAAKETT